jgi:hypothetical protein
MTSFRQIEANRSNARRSAGPKTEAGKRRSRRNAVLHGLYLTSQTVVVALEDIDDYQGFEASVEAGFTLLNISPRRIESPTCQTVLFRRSLCSLCRGAPACPVPPKKEKPEPSYRLSTSRPPPTSKCDNLDRKDMPSSPT